MYELKISVKKVLGTCTSSPPHERGDYFTVRDGSIRIPNGGFICLYALQSLIPLITPKEREIAEQNDQDWMWRVHHAQCPDPDGRVIFKIERIDTIDRQQEIKPSDRIPTESSGVHLNDATIQDLKIEVEEVRGKCTSGMISGDHFTLRVGKLHLPPDGHICLYALQSVIPLLPANQRMLAEGDWMINERRVICPDPAGNVILRIDRKEHIK